MSGLEKSGAANYDNAELKPGTPEVAKDVKVLAVQPGELQVSWTIPELALGKLASSRAVAFLKEKNVNFCSANAEPYTCVLSELLQGTEYTVVVEVCVTPPDAESYPDSESLPDSGALWCSTTTGVQQKTLGESPEAAKGVSVLSLRPGELNVSWTIPELTLGRVAYSRAIALLEGRNVTSCSANYTNQACVLQGLAHATVYTVVVEVCVTPSDAESFPDSSATWCSTTTDVQKMTLSQSPEVAEGVTVRALRTKELQVSWTIPKLALGTLASSRATAFSKGKNVTSCSANAQPYTCVLSELDHATEYTVFVEVCVIPPDAESFPDSGATWCSTTTGVQKKTLSQ
ncbi:unnamed protein product [Dibothriocephalus latus]|uniref:Fibronectin type-III domain-containing protein n=1 Tax=Dibothriocephalus latus TaxID=60516 RepID=A0A3P6TKA3_DIBLA|nr:unnamed protein product [Dibothriocephalus latus]